MIEQISDLYSSDDSYYQNIVGTLFGRVDIHLPQVILAVIFRREVFLSNPRLILSGQPISITARLAQSVEHETLNLRVVGSSPTLGERFFFCHMCGKMF